MTHEQFNFWLEGFLEHAAIPLEIKKVIQDKMEQARKGAPTVVNHSGVRIGAPTVPWPTEQPHFLSGIALAHCDARSLPQNASFCSHLPGA